MHDRGRIPKCGTEILRPRQIPDHRAVAVERNLRRPSQQHADAIPALRQLGEELASDEAGSASQGDQGHGISQPKAMAVRLQHTHADGKNELTSPLRIGGKNAADE